MAEVLVMAGRLGSDELRDLQGLAGRLGARGIAVRVACVAAVGPAVAGLEVVEQPGLGSRWRRDWAVRRLRLLNTARPDLIHVLGAEMAEAGLAAAEHWGLPYLLTIDAFLPPGSRLRLSQRRARGIIATGADLAEDLRAGFGVPRSCIEVIPAGIALPEVEAPTPVGARVPVVGTAGPLVPSGGLPTYFDAARRLLRGGLDVEFVVEGQGLDEPAMRRLAARMGIADRVTFADDRDVGPAFWGVLDVFCRISLVPDSGRTLGTAMAYGVPAVASDVPGLRGWIRPGETGLLIPPDDPEALAGAIRTLLADRALARSFGAQARAWIARHHDPDREADLLAAAYRCVQGAPGPAPVAGFEPVRQPAG